MTLVAASLDVVRDPFGSNANVSASKAAMGTPSATPSRGGGLSKGEKDAAIAVPVIVGCLLAACKRRAPQPGLIHEKSGHLAHAAMTTQKYVAALWRSADIVRSLQLVTRRDLLDLPENNAIYHVSPAVVAPCTNAPSSIILEQYKSSNNVRHFQIKPKHLMHKSDISPKP